jgi:UDP:flavonoid glycosyltransferase YjiC (YdhE family)
MRVLLSSTPTYGSFHPIVPLARAIIAAGHEVRVACPASFRGAVEAAGLPFVAAGSAELPSGLVAELDLARPDARLRSRLMLTRVLLGVQARAMVPDVLALIDNWQPDLILRGHLEYGGYIAAELRGLPHASTGAVNFPPPALYAAMLEALADLRSAFDLPPDPDGASMFRYLVLAPMPGRWVPPDAIVPPTIHFLRPEPFNASGAERLPPSVTALPSDRPTVHASLGTLHNDLPGVYEAILAGLRDEPLNLVLTIGRERDPAAYGPQPATVVIERYIPHELLLPRCDAMLTHCGLNTIMACLTLGLPMVGVPITADQPRNAERLAALGTAVLIGSDDRTPEAFRAATWEVLSNPSYRRSAESLRDEIAAMPGAEHGVALLERLALERRPLLATRS